VNGSGYYEGWVRHRRYAPVAHAFGYRHAMLGLDLASGRKALASHPWFAWRQPAPIRFHRDDYLGPAGSDLLEAVRACVRQQCDGLEFTGAVELVTQPRAWGFSFNPVSFYLCHHGDGRLAAIVAEITNTPWLERCTYALAVPTDHHAGEPLEWTFAKRFHISPFNPMQQTYRWRFIVRPGAFAVHMLNLAADGSTVFDATLVTRRRPLTGGLLARLLRVSPLLNLQVALRIYLQARRLWAKRAPFHAHPRTLVPAGA